MANYGIKGKPVRREEFVKHEPLPAGVYVGRIIDAKPKIDISSHIVGLTVAFDVDEGEYKGFFATDYNATKLAGGELKWRGTMTLWMPNSGDPERDERTEKQFLANIWCIADSNGINIDPAGDFDERILKGKLVGLNYRNREWEYNGQTGMTTECGRFESVRDIRDGKVKQMKDKLLANKRGGASAPAQASTNTNGFTPVDGDDELPF